MIGMPKAIAVLADACAWIEDLRAWVRPAKPAVLMRADARALARAEIADVLEHVRVDDLDDDVYQLARRIHLAATVDCAEER